MLYTEALKTQVSFIFPQNVKIISFLIMVVVTTNRKIPKNLTVVSQEPV